MHECPNCGQACYCSGDIEDHDTGDEYIDGCECPCWEEEHDDGFDEDDEIALPDKETK